MAPEHEQRRLTTILAADVAGFSRLVGADEEATLRRLRDLRRELIDPAIAANRGRIFKTMGDGILIEFASVVDAVRCAVAVQHGMEKPNAEYPSDKRILFRVGVHLGDVVVQQDGDLLGDGVNIAARLEGRAEPGGICLSHAAFEQVRGKIDATFADIGDTALKNIAQPVRVYRWRSDGAKLPRSRARKQAPLVTILAGILVVLIVAAGGWYFLAGRKAAPVQTAAAPAEPAKPAASAPLKLAAERLSIVVLPFTNLSGDASQDYVADAITEELTTALSRLRDSFVIARTTAVTYKGKPIDVKQIGTDLGVRYVLEGSAQRGGDRVRVTAQLIDAETGAHLWADQFDQPRAELLDMQDEIVTRLTRALDLQLSAADIARTQRLRPNNLDAEDLALRCRSEFERNFVDPRQWSAALALCQQALALDERNGLALGNLAYGTILPVIYSSSADPLGDIQKADNLVSRALAVDANDAMAHLAKSFILAAASQYDGSIAEAESSVAANPSFINAYLALCDAYNRAGQPAKTLKAADRALRLSPRDSLSGYFAYFHRGWAIVEMDRYAESADLERRFLALAPNEAGTAGFLVNALTWDIFAATAADPDVNIREADEVSARAVGANPKDFFNSYGRSMVLASQNHLPEAIAQVAGAPPIAAFAFTWGAVCWSYNLQGEAAKAIECAEKALRQGPHEWWFYVWDYEKGWALFTLNNMSGAIDSLAKVPAVHPTWTTPHAFLAAALAASGKDAEAHDELKNYLAMPGVRLKTVSLWQGYWSRWPSENPVVLDFRKRFFDGLRKAGMPEQ